MIIRPQSLESFKHRNMYQQNQNNFDLRKKIENFTFLPTDKIGRGYSSTVYKGENQLTKYPVAIKVIQLKSLRDQNTKRFLTNELQCLRRLDHPNVLKYINSFMTANNCYIITELYNSGDLSKLLKEKVRFTQDEVFEFFLQFFDGYQHFSHNGYIHRDIKPSNILIRMVTKQDKDNDNNNKNFMGNNNNDNFNNTKSSTSIQQRQYVIADFGFIKYHTENPKDSFNVGTPVYMSPQSITSNIYTIKSDIWSMGVMLYQLVYGELPFSSRSQNDLKREICNKQLKIQQIQSQKGVLTSGEFKSFLQSCLRKNPQNRISLEDIKQHLWFKKYMVQNSQPNKAPIDYLNVFTDPVQTYDLNLRIPIIDISTPNQDEKKYGYIGNVAVKRQKSLQANHFALKNCYKNSPLVNKENVQISIDRHREKAKALLGVLNQKNTHKDYRSGSIKNSQQYFVQNHQPFKLKLHNNNAAITDSPKLEILLEKKNGIETRSSLLEGMKGVVNIKNNQILKINNYDLRLNKNSAINNGINRRPSYQKLQKAAKTSNLQASTSLKSNKFDSEQGLKQNQGFRLKSPVITSFSSLPSETVQLRKIHTQIVDNSQGNIENLSFIANGMMNITQNFLSSPLLPSQPSTEISQSKPTSYTAQQYCLKLLHLLRYIYEVISLIHEYKNESAESFIEARQLLQSFFIKLFVKLKKAILSKENLLNMQKWSKFIESEKYHNFVDVVKKYETKYSQSTIIGQRMKQYSQICDYLSFSSSQNVQSCDFTLLKLAQNLSSINKQTVKKSLRSSSSFNQLIIIIFNVHKCLQMMSKYIGSQQNTKQLQKMNPQKDLQEMMMKNKDPFKIPKMIIQLKKKLILIESGTFMETTNKNKIVGERIGRPKIEQSLRRISIK